MGYYAFKPGFKPSIYYSENDDFNLIPEIAPNEYEERISLFSFVNNLFEADEDSDEDDDLDSNIF